MPTARMKLAVAASGTKLFAVGGVQNIDEVDALEIYESATDSWSAAAPMPTARSSLAAAIVGNTLFALGGQSGVQLDRLHQVRPDYTKFDVAEAYDIEGGSWSAAEPMGNDMPREGFAAVAGP